MTPDIREYYRVLELSPGASLSEIKAAYRRLVNQWHPDRFKTGSVMQTTAEDVTKELNEAYHQLFRKKRYLEFRRHREPRARSESREPWTQPQPRAQRAYTEAARGRSVPPSPPPPRPQYRSPEPRPTAAEPPPPAKPPVAPPARPKPSHSSRRRSWPWAMLAIALLFAAGVALRIAETTRDAMPFAAATMITGERIAAPRTIAAAAPVRTTSDRASIATSEGEAGAHRDIWVTPINETLPSIDVREFAFAHASDSWRSSLVAGEDMPSRSSSTVAKPSASTRRWRTFAESPSDSAAAVNDALSLLDTFAVGDTKARVLALQGVPDETGERIFRFGSSLVYFADGRVVGWRDGWPRLRIFELPRFVFGGLATFGVGSSRSEVVRAQGTPTAVGDSVYFYGNSVVFFDRDWVTGWREIDEPLRARAWPAPAAMLLPRRL